MVVSWCPIIVAALVFPSRWCQVSAVTGHFHDEAFRGDLIAGDDCSCNVLGEGDFVCLDGSFHVDSVPDVFSFVEVMWDPLNKFAAVCP